MSNLHVKYILIGGGAASSAAARAIRQIDEKGDLLLIGQEIHRPYHRPPLSNEFLRREKAKIQLFTESSEWFIANHVQLRTGRRVTHIDSSRDCIALDNGEEISFDKLLIATGGSPAPLNIPGALLPNLFYLRTLEDAEHLLTATDKAKREGRPHPKGRGRATVIGAGLLGVEIAASLAQAGLAVDLIAAGPFPWNHFAGETTGRLITAYLEKRGIHLHTDNRAHRLEGDGRVQRVLLADGESIDCDFAVAAVGMIVHKELLRGSPIVAEKAILVDSHCRTSQPNVYAAGDCAAVLDPLFAKHRLLSQWDSAAISGKIAGTNMAGGNAAYHTVSRFDTNIVGLTCTVWGEAKLVQRRLVRGIPNPESPDFIEIGIASDGRVAQVIALGNQQHNQDFERLVSERTPMDGKEEIAKDPAIPISGIFKNS